MIGRHPFVARALQVTGLQLFRGEAGIVVVSYTLHIAITQN